MSNLTKGVAGGGTGGGAGPTPASAGSGASGPTASAAKSVGSPAGGRPAHLRPVADRAPATGSPSAAIPQPQSPPPVRPAPTAVPPAKPTATSATPARAKPAVKPAPGRAAPTPIAAPAKPALAAPFAAQPRRRTPRKRRGWGVLSFLVLVVLPTVLIGWFYNTVASDQYQSETRFAVRGTDVSPLSLLGFSALPGNTSQGADAYIVNDYVNSAQVLRDLIEEQGLDVRKFFAGEGVDPVYRVDPDMPLEEFLWYWEWMTDVEFNSTTQITTFRVNAFSAEDSGTITAAVLKAAAKLVNELSTEAQTQLIKTAQAEVDRTEARLTEARQALLRFRDTEQQLDPKLQAESDQTLITGLEKELIELRARRTALLSTVNRNSPSVRVLDRQISAAQAQLDGQRSNIGSGGAKNGGNKSRRRQDREAAVAARTRSRQLNEYEGLQIEREFAEKAYTSALSSLETSQAEARKQERYFAIVVEPTVPSVALYPYRIVNTIIGFAIFFVLWLFAYLIFQSVRDHAT